MRGSLTIDVYIDLICPWCLIGKSHLRRALRRLAETDPDIDAGVHWHSVQLMPDVPEEGLPFAQFYERRLGGKQAAQARQAQVRAAAARADVSVDFSRIATFPNTAKAHRLLTLGVQKLDAEGLDRLLDRLFAGYFQRGEDLGDSATLTAIAAEHDLDPDTTRAALTAGGNAGSSARVEGVPYFVFNRRYAISGAHPAEVLHSAMRQAVGHGAPPAARSN